MVVKLIKNIIFDLGNVLLNFKPLEYLNSKLSDEDKCRQVYKEIFLSEEWLMLDRGAITEEEAIDRIYNRSLENGELIRACMDNWYELLTPMEETVEILKEIRENGYRTFVLSNFHLLAYENVTKRYDFFKYFEGGIISYKENLLKPDSDIYKKLIKRYDLVAEESIFIDDTKANVEGATKLGIRGIVFDGSANLRKKLLEYKVLNKTSETK